MKHAWIIGVGIGMCVCVGGGNGFAENIPWCSGVEQMSTIDAKIIFHYRGTDNKVPDTCVGPSIRNYTHRVYGAKTFNLREFMETIREDEVFFFGRGEIRNDEGGQVSVATILIVGKDEGGAARGWNVVMTKNAIEKYERVFFMDILNEKTTMLPFDAPFALLAEMDPAILRFHSVPEKIFYDMMEPYIQYLLGFAEGRGV